MESRFAHLRQRDTSVSMLRVKMSRRRSQSQKENRELTVNTRRRLDKLPELEGSMLNASIPTVNMPTVQERTQNSARSAKTAAQEERLKRLERWKEQKALEKEKKEREHKRVFKTGLYQPKDSLHLFPMPVVPPASSRPKEKKVSTAPTQSTRVTRSMKQQQQQGAQKPLTMQHPNTAGNEERSTRTRAASVKSAPAAAATTKTKVCADYPAVLGPVRALSTRSATKTLVTKASVVKDNAKPTAADVRTTRSKVTVNPLPPSHGRVENSKAVRKVTCTAAPKEAELKENQIHEAEKTLCPEEEGMMVGQPPEESVPAEDDCLSFAPEGFVFQAPAGLSSFKFEPLTPRSADAFLTPSSSFNVSSVTTVTSESQFEPSDSTPPKTPDSFPGTSPAAPQTSQSPQELKHDVPYFRSEISKETEKLTSLCLHWESKVEDESIPEEMQNRMRTAVGQARLLMKERFNQFSGLVDDCELGRGEKVTTCTDLQGFWDMVYFQVEDVNKKFDALKEAEGRGWVEEHEPLPRQRKVMKKPPAASAKPTGSKAAAKSRLAAVKAAMKAKQQAAEAERAAKDAVDTEHSNSQEQEPQEGAKTEETLVFDGGFFKVESPAKSVRRSSRLSAAVHPQASPLLSPRQVTRRSVALAQTPVGAQASPAQPVRSPEQTPAPKSQRGTPQACRNTRDAVNASLCFSPVKEVVSDEAHSEQNPTRQSESISTQEDLTPVPEMTTNTQVLPTVSVEMEENRPTDSPKCSRSMCKTPPVVHAPELPSSLSFALSPCLTPSRTPISLAAVQLPAECHTPDDSTTEEIPGLDFERYLQPSQRFSLSPRDTAAEDMLTPMETDVEMESPRCQPEELFTQQEPAQSPVSSVFTLPSPQVRTVESDLLLFTPNLKDRIRESVCPTDLMVFTPPNI